MISKVIGVDLNGIAMTMLALVGLYLILRNAGSLNNIIKTSLGSWNQGLVILQGRDPKKVL